ncbi:MAG: anaerobic sulfatase maturase [Anaerolineales bacterium]|jgi:uncharacterized protein|nr:anaerobic sulfatase maturase [Anaerolineales bacterium]
MNLPFFRRPVTEVLVKPSGATCNLACDYCYYLDKARLYSALPPRMSDAVLEAMIQQLMSQNTPQLSIGWQGGEPTLMGLPFYRKAVSLMEQYGRGQSVANGLQTNGMLVDGEWARFFHDYHFLVGLSIDGPEHIHDRYRRNPGGHGSWRKALDAAGLLLDHGVEVNVLTVINHYSVQFPDEIYQFHKSQGLNYMQFIPCVETKANGRASSSPSAASFGAFLSRLFDLWLADFENGAPTTSIRWFEALLLNYAGFGPTECTLMKRCGNYLLIEHTGDVYACDFSVEPEWKLGNLLETPLTTLFNSRQQASFGRLKADLSSECCACAWKQRCRGGCTQDRQQTLISERHYHFCEAYKRFFTHADARLQDLANAWKQNNAVSYLPSRQQERVPIA